MFERSALKLAWRGFKIVTGSIREEGSGLHGRFF
jgi:hypothetical protein